MLSNIMKEEKSYDVLPNFTAIDALRLTGVGRNEYIDMMNKCRVQGWFPFRKVINYYQYVPYMKRNVNVAH